MEINHKWLMMRLTLIRQEQKADKPQFDIHISIGALDTQRKQSLIKMQANRK